MRGFMIRCSYIWKSDPFLRCCWHLRYPFQHLVSITASCHRPLQHPLRLLPRYSNVIQNFVCCLFNRVKSNDTKPTFLPAKKFICFGFRPTAIIMFSFLVFPRLFAHRICVAMVFVLERWWLFCCCSVCTLAVRLQWALHFRVSRA